MKKKPFVNRSTSAVAPPSLEKLLGRLRALIQDARRQALRAVDIVQVRTCWDVGRHIVEFEQGGAARACYGAQLLARLAERLTAEFGKGFDERNLRHIKNALDGAFLPGMEGDLGIGNRLTRLDDELLKNLNDIQLRNGLPPSETLAVHESPAEYRVARSVDEILSA
ncbi:MAG: hypothetical protein HY360_01820 [Verrucomicrobia bacterium]|nr:hypothetical protein [Verrucomicrobiota bacterium]